MPGPVEGYSSAVNGSAGNSAPVGGRRHSHKLRLVKKKTVRRMLAKKGLKMRGGEGEGVSMEGGRKRRRTHRRRRHSLFHF